jgi:hypothetical protein
LTETAGSERIDIVKLILSLLAIVAEIADSGKTGIVKPPTKAQKLLASALVSKKFIGEYCFLIKGYLPKYYFLSVSEILDCRSF